MEALLRNDFTTHYGLPICTEPNLVITTKESYFEIEDRASKDLVLHTKGGRGMARFSNPSLLAISVTNYDKFMTSLPSHFEKGKKRCDMVVTSQSQFILGELKDRDISKPKKKRSVRSGSKEQLFVSLTTLLAVPQIAALANSKKIKKCCYFNKQSNAPALLSATSAFNRLSTLFQDGFKMSHSGIESHDFEFWEYVGVQTLTLT
jgi:hypothetical protein